MKHFDERDTMFSRLGLIPGTKKYRDYYAAHPEWQAEDDRVRESTCKTMARIFRIEQGQMKSKSWRVAAVLGIINTVFGITGRKMPLDPDRMLTLGAVSDEKDPDGRAMVKPAARMANLIQAAADKQKPARRKTALDPCEMSSQIKTLALGFGGDAAGIVKLKRHHHYTHRGDMFGMGAGYGKPIRLSYTHAVVIACALDQDMVNRAPAKETQIAAVLGYAASTAASAQLALYIKSLGYEARTDNVIEYLSPLVPLAAEAGIGQIGRCNMVVHPRFGNRLKLAAVLTNLPLVHDGPVDFGLVDFCRTCKKCAAHCPAEAISFDDPQMINGLWQWPHQAIRCMEMWMTVGTGICMAACPFSQGAGAHWADKIKGDKNPGDLKKL
ncbi:MAG: 4Fe-4S dicluster domain-containing protein [Deltaproteobacteria bacterium]|nr:4Fe-4S dicluster domain-containing protein [Deltaproteobacteria bacterium]